MDPSGPPVATVGTPLRTLQSRTGEALAASDYLAVGAAVVGAAVLAVVLASSIDFGRTGRPAAVRALFGTWLVAVVATLGAGLYDRTVPTTPATVEEALVVLAALVVASGLALARELGR